MMKECTKREVGGGFQHNKYWWMVETKGGESTGEKRKLVVSGSIKEGVEWSKKGVQNGPNEILYLKTPQASCLLYFATKTYPHLPNSITFHKSYLIL